MRLNLALDLLNRIIDSKISIYEDLDNTTSKEFSEKYKYSADYKLIQLILDNRELVYKYIFNELNVSYKLIYLERSKFNRVDKVINIEFDLYTFNNIEKDIINNILKETNNIISGNTNLSYSILYLLPFNNEMYYKFGISNLLNLSRLKEITNLYNIDLDKSIIYYGLKRDILLVESYIKRITNEIYNNPYKGKSGFSEIRDKKSFKNVLKKCEEQFSKDFLLLKFELKKLEKDWQKGIERIERIEKFIEIPNIDLPYIEII